MIDKISNANVLVDSFYKTRKNSIWKNSVQQYEANLLKNIRKTQIFRIDKGFTFLKIKYRLTDTGHLVRIPVKSNIVRERRKLKSFKKMLDNNEMTFNEIEEQYKSWRGNIAKYDCHRTLLNIDKLFNDLFLNNSQNSH